ncbi:glycosyltransferase family 2 protein [Gillisia sp. M10.2A]|uniref:Glycosyltransferase family 2 protein n=1 Tax=Gillisia lutea TaxID=2909668 RepID=A0ABS9EGW9_9FLAO|nr:glycosyltransferase family 2 protein [Gillisia lutea]MCF4102115.1 glycosyltransferase family 2 protein [Gillisia lutea]
MSLVSIIIPTYNRAHLIGGTLDSIISQTYTNWECIVVDDGSDDYTTELLEFYSYKDPRIQYFQRPSHLNKGANACRNFGLEKSKGEYIMWFDSDDLMLPDKIEDQILPLKGKLFGYSVSKFDNLINGVLCNENAYKNNEFLVLNGENYSMMNVFWGTIDMLVSRHLIKDIRFNEKLKSGQEYNFFSKLTLSSKFEGIYINKILSYRRVHPDSIQTYQNNNKQDYLLNKYSLFYNTYLECNFFAPKKVKLYMLKNSQSFSFRLALSRNRIPYFLNLIQFLYKELGLFKTLLFLSSITAAYSTGKGYQLLKSSFPIKL